jgi:hypothetical protein
LQVRPAPAFRNIFSTASGNTSSTRWSKNAVVVFIRFRHSVAMNENFRGSRNESGRIKADGVFTGKMERRTIQRVEDLIMILRMTEKEVNGVFFLALDGRIVLGDESHFFREKLKSLTAERKKKIVLNVVHIRRRKTVRANPISLGLPSEQHCRSSCYFTTIATRIFSVVGACASGSSLRARLGTL